MTEKMEYLKPCPNQEKAMDDRKAEISLFPYSDNSGYRYAVKYSDGRIIIAEGSDVVCIWPEYWRALCQAGNDVLRFAGRGEDASHD